MNWKIALNGTIAGAALLVVACGSPGSYSYGAAPAPSSNPQAATVGLRGTPLGQILVDGAGRSLYVFEADKSTMSSCYGDCASVWPPVLVSGSAVAGPGVNQSLLSTTTRRDGSVELVYNGHPLYYFVSDTHAGDITGQALNSFGAEWYVLSAAGAEVRNAR